MVMNYGILFLAIVFLIQAGGYLAFVNGGDPNAFSDFRCLGDGNYTNTYAANLNSTIQILHRDVDNNGFYNASVGQGTDRAHAVVLCRGDAQLDECKHCILESSVELSRSCPLQRQAVHWEYACMLRYSNATTYGVMVSDPLLFLVSPHNATDPSQFDKDASGLLGQLRDQAASGDSFRKVAVGKVNSSQTIYGMVHCTPDLSRHDCTRCLNNIYASLPLHCGGKSGCRIFSPSCNLRYEVDYPYYNETRLRELDRVVVSTPTVPVSIRNPPIQSSVNHTPLPCLII